MNVNERLKYIRNKKNISLSELSKMTGIAKSTLQRYETGSTRKIPLEAISIIEKSLFLDAGYLMGWSKTADDNINKDKINKMVWDENDEQNSSVTLSTKEISHIKLYRKLNDLGKKRVDDYMNDISEVSGYLYNEEDNRSTPYIAAHDGKIKKSKKISLKTAKKLNNQ